MAWLIMSVVFVVVMAYARWVQVYQRMSRLDALRQLIGR